MTASRRAVLRSLSTLPAAFTTACTPGPGTPEQRPPHAGPADRAHGGPADGPGDGFDEVYRGRRVQGIAQAQGPPLLFIDHRPLHLMRCADGGYVTPLDHYDSAPTPSAAARKAVDALGSAQLSRFAAWHGGGREGGAHGVHA